MTFYIVSNGPSTGASNLRSAFINRGEAARRVILENSDRIPAGPNDFVINWGSSALHDRFNPSNSGNAVSIAANKRSFFLSLGGYRDSPRIPDWTANPGTARQWLNEGHVVVARTVLTGHSGDGIRILERPVDMIEAPLYTKYVKKAAEYRVHFGPDGIFDVQRKAIRQGAEDVNHRVRTFNNGYVYVRREVAEILPADVTTQALLTINCVPLRHGAIDIIYNRHQEKAYVLEVNTAPGAEGTTAEKYAAMFSTWDRNRINQVA